MSSSRVRRPTIRDPFRRKHVREFIARHVAQTGIPPTVREIAQGVGISSTSVVHFHLLALEAAGEIKRMPCRARSICLTPSKGPAAG